MSFHLYFFQATLFPLLFLNLMFLLTLLKIPLSLKHKFPLFIAHIWLFTLIFMMFEIILFLKSLEILQTVYNPSMLVHSNLHDVRDHPISQVIGDFTAGVRTRRQASSNFCMFLNFVSRNIVYVWYSLSFVLANFPLKIMF